MKILGFLESGLASLVYNEIKKTENSKTLFCINLLELNKNASNVWWV